MPKEFRGYVIQPHSRCEHKVEAQTSFVPASYVPTVRVTEAVLSSELALLFGYVPFPFEES